MICSKKKLALAMARACLTYTDLVEKVGIPQATVKNVVVGRSVRPATLGRVAKALGCDPIELLADEEER